ncbi:MAG: polysaccharide biosynthesis protein, partial [Clostridia bacterium]|nr:polysaccharide biosynthesis protein [Clostridia bacterium]
VIRPLIAAIICAAAALLAYRAMLPLLPDTRYTALIITGVCVIVACVVYAVFLLLLRAVTKNDIIMLPKGNKIVTILEKYHLIK